MNKKLTPKEKAQELYNFYWQCGDCPEGWAKLNAIKVADEILNNFGLISEGKKHFCDYYAIAYYQEVKQEIEKL